MSISSLRHSSLATSGEVVQLIKAPTLIININQLTYMSLSSQQLYQFTNIKVLLQ